MRDKGKAIKAALYQTALDNPTLPKDEIITMVSKQLDLPDEQRPAIRRCKAQLIKELTTIKQVLEN